MHEGVEYYSMAEMIGIYQPYMNITRRSDHETSSCYYIQTPPVIYYGAIALNFNIFLQFKIYFWKCV